MTEEILWIKVSFRPITEEEKEFFPDGTKEIFDCPIPDDGEEVLVQTSFGVDKDIFCNDNTYGCGGENYDDWTDVIAWAKMPKGIEVEE